MRGQRGVRRPLSTGHALQNVTLESFSGTFEISVRRPDASEALGSFSKMCSFSLSEYVCKDTPTDGGPAASKHVTDFLSSSWQFAQKTER